MTDPATMEDAVQIFTIMVASHVNAQRTLQEHTVSKVSTCCVFTLDLQQSSFIRTTLP